jgi:acetyltransferase-like isoleucine patch superfamily enzyme
LLDKYFVRNILPCLLLKQTGSWGGYRSKLGKWGENVRIGVLTQVNNPQNMFFEGHNFVWNYCILDAVSDKIYIGANTQIGAYVEIFTHNTHISVRLAKEQSKKGLGYQYGPVKIGRNCFISSGAKILHGVTIGDNVIVGVNSVVNRVIPDFSIVAGVPAKKIGDTRALDKSYLHEGFNSDWREKYGDYYRGY